MCSFYLSLSTFIINCMAYEYLWMYIHGTGGVTAEKKLYHKFNVLFVGKGWFDVVHISKKIPSDSLKMDEKVREISLKRPNNFLQQL